MLSRAAPASPWKSARVRALDALFPPRCGGCHRFSRAIFCERCAPRLRALREPQCAICGQEFDPLARGAAICARCRAHPPAYEKARAAWSFEGAAREAVHAFKYNRRFAYAPRLASALLETAAARAMLETWQPQWLVPVPLHAARLRERGFNQSALLARELSSLCGVPALEVLRRTRRTPPQVGLEREERRRNVRDAFAVNEVLWQKHGLQNARVLLIDDVFTTGATIAECAQTLLKAGAGEVGALTIARQQRPDEARPPENRALWESATRF